MRVQPIDESLEEFLKSTGFNTWSSNNPISSKSLKNSLYYFVAQNRDVKGLNGTIQLLCKNAVEEWGEWWNYFSELRCSHYIGTNISPIGEYNYRYHKHVIDFKLVNGHKWDVVSFSGKTQNAHHEGINDEKTITNLYNDKVLPKLRKQKADFVVIDDIFSMQSRNYPLTEYFFDQAYSTRKNLFKRIFREDLHKVLVLSFKKDFFHNPKVVFKGKNVG